MAFVLFLLGVVISCKDTNTNTNSNIKNNNIKAIEGAVFPANEVCNYPKGSILEKFGRLNQYWKKDNFIKDNDPKSDPNLKYSCGGYDYYHIKTLKDVEISIGYNALGSKSEGSYRIAIEYQASWQGTYPASSEKLARDNFLIPFCNEITKKALKQSFSSAMTKKIQSIRQFDALKDDQSNLFCEKLGEGYVCVYESTANPDTKNDSFIDFRVFASEEAYQSFKEGNR